jgi:hypothetical protein
MSQIKTHQSLHINPISTNKMIQYILENINEIKLLLSYWNYLIIKNQLNPSFCIKGIAPYSQIKLSVKLQTQFLQAQNELFILEHKYDQLNLQLGVTIESTELLKKISQHERSIWQMRIYMSYLNHEKHIWVYF